jgi:hypothetical protein
VVTSTPRLVVGFGTAVAAAVAAQVWLQATFASVRHPASLATANTTGDPAVVRGWYATLVEQGTLSRMVATELVDLAWIAALAAVLVLGTTLAARGVRRRSPQLSGMLARAAPWTALAPGLDLLENALSLVMLSNPHGFPDALAPAHAAVSWAKLAAVVAVPATLGVLTVGTLIRRPVRTADR